MKKALIKIAVLLSAAVLFITLGCKQQVHVHTFSTEWKSDDTNHWHAATCEHTDEMSGKTEHTFNDGEVTAKPDCENKGTKTYKCAVCGYTKTEEIAVTGHIWDDGEVTTAPTCTAEGEETFACTACGKTKTEPVAALGHTYSSSWSKDSDNHWHAATCGHDERIGITSHTEDSGTVTTVPGVMSKGIKTYKCSVCGGNERTEELDALGWCESPIDAETYSAATKESTYVYFGVFPKNVLPQTGEDIETVTETISMTMGSNTYYQGSKGNWYVKVTENALSEYLNAYTDGTNPKLIEDSSIRYFKVEPIKWKVLTTNYNGTGKVLLFAEEILTSNIPYYYHEFGISSNRTIGTKTIYGNNYRYSTIRAYLNGKYEDDDIQLKTYDGKGFLQTAFTAGAQALITETEIDNSGESTIDSKGEMEKADGTVIETGSLEGGDAVYYPDFTCENTTDKIFLLSEKEVTTTSYGFDENCNMYGLDNTRIRKVTDYARANYCYQKYTRGYGGYWWLRSPYAKIDYYAHYVRFNGLSSTDTEISYLSNGIVPALTISLD